jgi:hypothetical protein
VAGHVPPPPPPAHGLPQAQARTQTRTYYHGLLDRRRERFAPCAPWAADAPPPPAHAPAPPAPDMASDAVAVLFRAAQSSSGAPPHVHGYNSYRIPTPPPPPQAPPTPPVARRVAIEQLAPSLQHLALNAPAAWRPFFPHVAVARGGERPPPPPPTRAVSDGEPVFTIRASGRLRQQRERPGD